MLRNASEDGLIRPKHVVQQEYICKREGMLAVIFHVLFYSLLIKRQDTILRITESSLMSLKNAAYVW
jgi:hypothetical protein